MREPLPVDPFLPEIVEHVREPELRAAAAVALARMGPAPEAVKAEPVKVPVKVAFAGEARVDYVWRYAGSRR